MKLAIFDFDGTVLRGNSWQLFFRQHLSEHPARAPWLFCAGSLRCARLVSAEWLQNQVLAAWRGHTAEEVADIGREFYAQQLRPRLREAALAEIARRRAEGFHVVVASAAWSPLLAPFTEEHGIETWTGTPVEFSGGRCTGRLACRLTRGENKRAWIEKTFSGTAIDWKQSCAYGDEPFDFPMLALVGEPVFVTPGEPPLGLPAGTRTVAWM